ncbi:MAG: VWA domain-containing protein [Campylobacterales bacterium]|nr:VWA domain-containing protein [Campylobacterales bacterium]
MIEFVNPNIIFLLSIPVVLFLFVVLTRKSRSLKDFSEEILEKLETAGEGNIGRKGRFVFLFLSLFLMTVALARPVLNHGEKEVISKGIEMTVVLDVSASMMARDIYPNRLAFAKEKIKQFIKTSKNDKIGIIAYAGGSFLVSPPTSDKETLIYLLESLSSDTISMGGSDLLSAIKGVDEMIEGKKRNVVVFSDGGEEEFGKIGQFAKEKAIKIYTVGVGTIEGSPIERNSGEFVKDRNGNIVITKLNEDLKDLALESGGAYVKGTISSEDVAQIYDVIKKDNSVTEYDKRSIEDYTELFYYPLAVSLFLLLFGFFSMPVRKEMALLLLLAFPTTDYALSFNFDEMEKAEEAYKSGNYKEAIKQYESIKGGDQSLEARKNYNIGNSYFKQGDFENAVKAYEKSLSQKPKDEDTKHNLELAKKKLEKQKQQQKKDDKNSQDKDKDKQKQQDQKSQDKKEEQSKKEDSKENQEQQNKEGQEDQDKKDPSKETSKPKDLETDNKEISEREKQIYLNKMKERKNPLMLKPIIRGRENDKTW